MILRITTIVLFALMILAIGVTSAGAYSTVTYQPPGSNLFSVFGLYDVHDPGVGFGVAYDKVNIATNAITDFTYTNLPSNQALQIGQLYGISLFGYPIYVGLTAGYSDGKSGALDAYSGVNTGLEAILLKSQNRTGLSFDLRVASLSNGLNPVKWVVNPDNLWAGVGATYGW